MGGTLQQSSILAPVLLAIGAVETASFPGWEPTDFKMKEGYVPGSYANLEGLSPWTKDKLSAEDYLPQELVQGGQPVMFTLLERIATYEIPALFQEFHQ